MLTLWKESYDQPRQNIRASLIAQLVKNPAAMRETWVLSLGWEDPLEKEMATHSSILAGRIPRTEEQRAMGLQRVRHGLVTKDSNNYYVDIRAGMSTCCT